MRLIQATEIHFLQQLKLTQYPKHWKNPNLHTYGIIILQSNLKKTNIKYLQTSLESTKIIF